MKKLVNIALAAALASIIGGCAKTKVATPQAIVPLYATIDSVADMDSVQVRRFMETDSAELRAMFEVLGCDSLSYDEVMAWSNSLPVSIFTPAVDSVYPTLAPLEQSLGSILANAETDSLHLPSRTYVAVVWGKRYPIIFNGENMLIALNHYLGSEYDGYEHWPAYARLDKTPERLPYDIAEALVGNEYPYQGGDAPTVLSRMIYEGVLAYAKMQLVPESDITQALGYNEQQLDWLDEHRSRQSAVRYLGDYRRASCITRAQYIAHLHIHTGACRPLHRIPDFAESAPQRLSAVAARNAQAGVLQFQRHTERVGL